MPCAPSPPSILAATQRPSARGPHRSPLTDRHREAHSRQTGAQGPALRQPWGRSLASPARSRSPPAGLNPRPPFQIPRPAGKGGPAERSGASGARPSPQSVRAGRPRGAARGWWWEESRPGGGRGAGLGGREAEGRGREGARAPGRKGRERRRGPKLPCPPRPGGLSWRPSRSLRREGLGLPQPKAKVKGRARQEAESRGQGPGPDRAAGAASFSRRCAPRGRSRAQRRRSTARPVPGGRPLQNRPPGRHRGPRASPGGEDSPAKLAAPPESALGEVRRPLYDPDAALTTPGRAPSPPAVLGVTRERALQTGHAHSPRRARGGTRCGDFAALDDNPALARDARPSLLLLLTPVCTSPRASAPVPGTQPHSQRASPQPGPRPQSVLLAPQPWGGGVLGARSG